MSSSTPLIRGNSLYKFVDPITWSDAESKAQALGGHLITIDNEGENQFAESIASQGFYIGYNRKVGDWSWGSGTSLRTQIGAHNPRVDGQSQTIG